MTKRPARYISHVKDRPLTDRTRKARAMARRRREEASPQGLPLLGRGPDQRPARPRADPEAGARGQAVAADGGPADQPVVGKPTVAPPPQPPPPDTSMQERERAVARLTPEELQTMLDLNRKMLGRPTSAEAKAEADRLQCGLRSST